MTAATLRLEVVDGEAAGQVVDLSGISILGRDPACALVVPHRVVSREHAVIRPEEGFGFIIEDLDSRAGTFVNGVKTRKAVLQDGDAVRIGPTTIRVRITLPVKGEVAPEEVEVVKTRFMPTTRLTLDAVKFRMRGRDLSESAPEQPDAADEADADPITARRGTGRLVPADTLDAPLEPAVAVPLGGADAAAAVARLENLVEISTSLAAIHDPTRLARETALRIFGMFPQARRIGLFELEEDPSKGGDPLLRPRYLVDRSARAKGERVQVSQSVLRLAIDERRAVLSEDVAQDPRLMLSKSLSESGVTSIVCAPLCLGERVLGALYVDSADAGARFDGGSLRLLTGVAAILAAAVENSRLFARIQLETVRRANLERYFSPDLVERVLKGEVPLARQGQLAHGTILFVDIRGFTRLTDTIEPIVLVATLNAYFAAMQRTIFRSGGTVERFGGDSILAYWGVVGEDREAPRRAARAALAMQVEVFRLNPELIAAQRPPIKVAVGINTGDVIVGEVGSPERYEFTILGDAANLARRLETQAGPWEVIAGASTIADLDGRALHRPLAPVMVKGKDVPVALSALHGVRVDDDELPGAARWELAIPARLDLGLAAPVEALASGLELERGKLFLDLFTHEDPLPGVSLRVALAMPRAPAPVILGARSRGASSEDTLMLPPGTNAAALAAQEPAVQKIRLELEDAAAARAALGLPPS